MESQVRCKWFPNNIEYTCAICTQHSTLSGHLLANHMDSMRAHQQTIFPLNHARFSIFECRNSVYPNEMHKRQTDHCTKGFTIWKTKNANQIYIYWALSVVKFMQDSEFKKDSDCIYLNGFAMHQHNNYLAE